ncbi:hypothetical protein BGZ57DRAFT_349462 [Hyaloscypha finlandica]|nr:hypothetical protein BGZ57DRAFT_349462 [Hyaloscypha finlandica]
MEQAPPDEAESTWLDNSEPSAGDGPGVSRPGDSHRPQRSRQTPWSEWTWSNDYNCYYRCRVGASGTYEYEYYSAPDQLDTPRVVPEGSSADYAPQELQPSSYPPLPSPLDGITEGVANSNLISPSSTRTYPQAQTREPSVDKEQLDPRFKVLASWHFKVGRVFKVLWAEPRGDGGASVAGRSVTNRPEKETIHSVRRFIIVNSMRGHCICLPIVTYNRQGTNKKGVNPATHTIIYSGNTPVVLPGENLTRKPIRIIPFTPRDKLETTSRLDYAKVYTIEFNVKVCFIGVIHDDSKDQLLKGFAEVQSLQVPCEPLSNSQPPSQPVRKVLDPDG